MLLASLGSAAQPSAELEEAGQLAIPPSSTLSPRLPHFYGHAADMPRVQGQLAASRSSAHRLSLAAAPELQRRAVDTTAVDTPAADTPAVDTPAVGTPAVSSDKAILVNPLL